MYKDDKRDIFGVFNNRTCSKNINIYENISLLNIANAKEETKTKYMNCKENVRNSIVDYVLCKEDMEIIRGIDISISTDISNDEKERNEFKDFVFKSIGKQLYRVIYPDKLKESAKFIVRDLTNSTRSLHLL